MLDPAERGPALTVAHLRALVDARLARVPRLRQRLAPTPFGLASPIWVDDPQFDVAEQVRAVATDAAAGPDEPIDRGHLRSIVARVMSERLDPARPLWRIDVVEHLEGGGAALVIRLHHCMADGHASVQILSALLLDAEPEPGPGPGPALEREPDAIAPWAPTPAPGAARLLALAARDRLAGAVAGTARAGGSLVTPGSWLAAGRTAARVPATLRREFARSQTASPLATAIGDERTVAFASVSLVEAKRIETAFGEGVTVNDVVLTAVAGGLRRWLAHSGAGVADFRVKVPVSLHGRNGVSDALANRDSLMFVDLPLVENDPVRRLLAISAETRARKRDHDAETLDALFRDLAHVSGRLERMAQRWAMSPRVFALSVSNVPGPPEPRFVAGRRLRELYSLAEVASRHALRASVISADGTLFFGLCADAAAVVDLDLVASGIEDELAALLDRAGV